jgi:hypothetical protein
MSRGGRASRVVRIRTYLSMSRFPLSILLLYLYNTVFPLGMKNPPTKGNEALAGEDVKVITYRQA